MSADMVLASELQPGTYVVLRTRTPLGFLVRWFCRSPWDHAVLVTAPGEIVQARIRGVTRGPLAQFKGCMAIANAGELISDAGRLAIAAKGLSYDRDEYALPLLVIIALRKLGIRWPWLVKIASDNDAVFCSELVALAGQADAKDWLCGEASPAYVRPDELAARKPFMRPVVWDA